jgi:hypothetical protein
MQYENKVETTKGIYSFNLQGENSLKGVQKPSQKDHLPLNATYVWIANLKELEENLKSCSSL